ncbi:MULTISPECIES: helix-turn-helix domain-containing protein [Hafniaceae]
MTNALGCISRCTLCRLFSIASRWFSNWNERY